VWNHRIRREAPAKDLLLAGLERLEFRGYDSAGIALPETTASTYVRAVGNLANLKRSQARTARTRRRGSATPAGPPTAA
jgi:glucosamine 6-phosphate synthetase-like amidotransferase/phosphosugar isomerase protein